MTFFDVHPTLSQNQKELLELLRAHRFATTNQLARFTRPRYGSAHSASRQTLRHLAGLSKAGFVTSLERRIGGWQGGSQVSVWALTTAGVRTLTGSPKRQRPKAISTTFLEHKLATTEVCLALTECTRELPEADLELTQEPDCWRRFHGPGGAVLTVRPDLAATLSTPEFTDRYFVEVDQATENPARVIRTTAQYLEYQRQGIEQERNGVFPALLWIVPHAKRQEQLTRHLARESAIPRSLWLVLRLEEVPRLVHEGPDVFWEKQR